MKWKLSLFLLLVVGCSACVRTQPQIVVVTSTFEAETFATPTLNEMSIATATIVFSSPLSTTAVEPIQSTPLPSVSAGEAEYVVQPGDTLYGIAAAYGVSLESLLAVNDLPNPDTLSVGQTIKLPDTPSETTNNFKILPDSRFVRGPESSKFNIEEFISQQPGYIRTAQDVINEETFTAAEVVERASQEYSVDARLLLALLEYRGGWLTKNDLDDTFKTFPMEREPSPPGFDRSGLYKQLAWSANQLNRGYYGWNERNWTTLELKDGVRLLYAADLNAATVGVQHFLSQNNDSVAWRAQVSPEGFYQTYVTYFGDPFAATVDPLIPETLSQPDMTLPFSAGETWFFTGGPHGGWGSGSAWSAIDFAPPDERTDESPPCYISEYWATAVAGGVITHSYEGMVILDMDMDGDETTGWMILYLHISSEDRVAAGSVVQAGDRIGHPSCEGGFSNGTHMHIARRYNGEWVPASCDQCKAARPPFVLSGWSVIGISGQEYQGYLVNGNEQRTAEQSRLLPINWVTW